MDEFKVKLEGLHKPVIQKANLQKLSEVAALEAEKSGLPAFKYATNDEMLAAMGLKQPISR
jgi:hypothetical protein